jgi:hypothetical protein
LKALVIHSRNFGWKYQYSHGLSVYFPWAEPVEDREILNKYRGYAFTKDLGESSWLSFLETYFTKTKRLAEANASTPTYDPTIDVSPQDAAHAAQAGVGVGVGASISNSLTGALSEGEGKVSGSTGAACSCPSIKNYPIEQS